MFDKEIGNDDEQSIWVFSSRRTSWTLMLTSRRELSYKRGKNSNGVHVVSSFGFSLATKHIGLEWGLFLVNQFRFSYALEQSGPLVLFSLLHFST